jgi:hypothetical protein
MYACIEQGRPDGMAGIALDVAYRRERPLATSDPSASPVLSRVSGVRSLDQTRGSVGESILVQRCRGTNLPISRGWF